METYLQTGIIILWQQLALSLIRIQLQVIQQQIWTKRQKVFVQKVGHYRLRHRLTVKETSVAFPQSWVGITAMVLCTLRIRTGSGGALRHIMVLCVTACITMVVAYIPAATAAALGSMCGVSRLLKHIPVYGFYGYWRIKMPLLLSFTGSGIPKITEDKTLMPDFWMVRG